MIILFNSNEQSFTSLGLGVLSDATFGAVVEELNGGFELELEYPVDGIHFGDIGLQKILFTKPNAYDNPQPFRIYSITKPLHGLVTINAEHISYDMAGYTIKPIDGTSLLDTISKIQNGSIRPNPFVLGANFDEAITMKTKNPYAMRSLLAGGGDTLIDIYGGYLKFDKFNVNLLAERGSDRGVELRYGKNITELDQEINAEKMYTGIFPFFFAINTQTNTFLERYHEKVFIVAGAIPFTSGWLALENEALAFIPIVETIPVQVKSEGGYYDNVYWFKRQTATDVEIVGATPFAIDWLSLTEGGAALVPEELTIYKVKTVGDYEYTKYIWDGSAYISYDGSGFYRVPDPIPEPILIKNTVETIETEDYLDITTAIDRYIITGATEFTDVWLSDIVDGDPIIPEINKVYIVKTVGIYLDIKYKWDDVNLLYVEMEPEYYGNGIIYVDEAAEFQKILTLDLTPEFNTIAPTVYTLRAKALEYLEKNDIAEVVNSTKVSFIKLADSDEYERYSALETVELGDMVKVIYEALGVESSLQVIRTEFNVITEKYNEIELGEKAKNIADNAMTYGDNVSAFVNDERYTDNASVRAFIAETITAEYIQANNANLTEAQINDLKTMKINVSGLIEASSAAIDKLVANLLVAENAEITTLLTAGEIKVKGTIFAIAGEIGGAVIEDGVLKVPSAQIEGQLEAAQIKVEDLIITNSININDVFIVDVNGNVSATSLVLSSGGVNSSVSIDDDGKLTAMNAVIQGVVTTDTINVEEVVISNEVVIKYTTATPTEEQTVTFNASVLSSWNGGYHTIIVTAVANKTLWFNRTVTVTISYDIELWPYPKETIIEVYHITILAGNTQANATHPEVDGLLTNLTKDYHSPVTVVESRSTTTFVGLGVNANFCPDDEVNDRDLGSPDAQWNDIYLKNQPTVSSDRRVKKDILYDIDVYNEFFNKLKPASFKYITGSADRTHLGLITQDIRDTLEEVGIDSKDFAGYVKALKPKALLKAKEDLTEDDYVYAIRYSEFHALEIMQIQKLKTYTTKLEKRILELEKKFEGS